MAIRWLIIHDFCELLRADKNNTPERTGAIPILGKSYKFLLYK